MQQTPSTQKLEVHCMPSVHAVPFARLHPPTGAAERIRAAADVSAAIVAASDVRAAAVVPASDVRAAVAAAVDTARAAALARVRDGGAIVDRVRDVVAVRVGGNRGVELQRVLAAQPGSPACRRRRAWRPGSPEHECAAGPGVVPGWISTVPRWVALSGTSAPLGGTRASFQIVPASS